MMRAGMLVVGDEAHPAREASSLLLIASVQRSPTIRIKSVATAALRNPASALAWLSPSRILVSAGASLTVMKLSDAVLRSRSHLPAFHHDDIRDIQAPPTALPPPPQTRTLACKKHGPRARPKHRCTRGRMSSPTCPHTSTPNLVGDMRKDIRMSAPSAHSSKSRHDAAQSGGLGSPPGWDPVQGSRQPPRH